MIFHNEIFEDIWVGQKKVAYIKQVREDKKIDISLQPIGKDNEDIAIHRIKKVLSTNAGELDFTYKSTPEDIKETFGLSKKNYKKALTKLIEDKVVVLSEEGITLA